MIEHLLNSILPTIQGLGSLGYWFVALIFFAEAIVFVGLVIPGGIVALLLGALVAQGVFDLGALLFFATLGFCLGDTLSYSLGKRGSGFFKAKNRLLKEAHLEQGQAFFKKHGSRSVFLGRFIGVLRPLTPFLAGLTQMPFRRFFWLNLLSIVTWTYLHMIAGYFFGQTLWLVKLWTNRLELFLVLFVVVFAVFYSIKWFFIHKGESFWQAFNDLIKMQTRTLSHNPRLRKIALDYPRTLSWLHQRLTRKKFTGLPLTLLLVAFGYLALLFTGLTESVINTEAITKIDVWTEAVLNSFRHPLLIKSFLAITALGKADVIMTFTLASTLFFLLVTQRRWIVGLWSSVVGTAAFSYLGKIIIERPRPIGGFYQETSYSFPSAHAALAVAFYGFWLYWLWRRSRWESRVNLFFTWFMLVVLVGFSRLYLGVHYLSDVLAGYLLGALWLLVGISITEWLLRQKKELPDFRPLTKQGLRWAHFLTVCGLLTYLSVATVFVSTTNTKSLEPLPTIQSNNLADVLKDNRFSHFVETIDGNTEQPLNAIFLAANEQQLRDSLNSAGWLTANSLSIDSLQKSLGYWIRQKNYAQAPINPSFWHNQPSQLYFEKHLLGRRRQSRWQIKIWPTNITNANRQQVFVAALSQDIGRDWWLFGRKTDADIDLAREQLSKDLADSQHLASTEKIDWTKPVTELLPGNKYLTDGRLYLLEIK